MGITLYLGIALVTIDSEFADRPYVVAGECADYNPVVESVGGRVRLKNP